MCAIDDGERLEMWNERELRARIEHICDECRRTIAPREKYWLAKGRGYDGWEAYATCSHCHVGMEWLNINCGGFLHCGVAEEIESHAFEYPALAGELRPIFEGMGRKWAVKGALDRLPAMPATIKSTLADKARSPE